MPTIAERNKPRSTIRLSDLEMQKLLRMLDERDAAFSGRNKRRSPRQPFPRGVVTIIGIDQGVTVTPFTVRGRNISAHGMGFLHGQFVHPGSKCAVTLITPSGEQVGLASVVSRCVYLTGGVHEIGVQFNEVLNIEGLLEGLATEEPTDGSASASAGRADAIKLAGRVLYVDDSAASRRLISHHLTQMGLRVDECADIPHAMVLLKEARYDLLLLDIWLNDPDGFELLLKIRRTGVQTDAVAITGDERKETGERAMAMGFRGVIIKPADRGMLEDTLAPLMREVPDASPTRATPLVSTLWNDSSMRPLIKRFTHELDETVLKLDEFLINNGLKPTGRVYTLCLQIAADAGAYGYPPVVSIAKTLCMLIDHDAELSEVQQQISELRRKADAALAAI